MAFVASKQAKEVDADHGPTRQVWTTTVDRYDIASHKKGSSQQLGELARGRWGVENKLHWSLDVRFSQDASRIRQGWCPELQTPVQDRLQLAATGDRPESGHRDQTPAGGWDHDYLLSFFSGDTQLPCHFRSLKALLFDIETCFHIINAHGLALLDGDSASESSDIVLCGRQ